jgi:hypothetical protein
MDDLNLIRGDCLEEMPRLEAGSVNAIIADLPYGTTACEWDSIIPLVDSPPSLLTARCRTLAGRKGQRQS